MVDPSFSCRKHSQIANSDEREQATIGFTVLAEYVRNFPADGMFRCLSATRHTGSSGLCR